MSSHYDRAFHFLQVGRYQQAEEELGRALTEDPEDATALSILALCRLRQEDRDRAQELVERAIHLEPHESFGHFVRGEILLDRRRHDEALDACGEALDIDPHDFHVWFLIARIHADKNRWEDALGALDRALEIDPEDEDARGLKAIVLAQLGRADEAAQVAQEALGAGPESSFARSAAGFAALHAGLFPVAREHFTEALRLDPTNESAQAGLVESIKATNPLYRWFLGGVLWLQRAGGRFQMGLIIGAWLLVRVLNNLEDDHPALEPWVGPITIVYVGFVLLTWFAAPLSNLALRLHPLGRHALSREQRAQANWSAGLLGVALLAGLAALAGAPGDFGAVALFSFLMVFPVLGVFHCEKGWPRWVMIALAGIVAAIGLLGVGLAFLGALLNHERSVLVGGGLLMLVVYGAVGSTILSLFLGRVEPKR